MKYLATTCLLSESIKPRQDLAFPDFIRANRFVIVEETLVDIQRGIHRIKDRDPKKAAMLRQWLAEARGAWPVAAGREQEKARVLAAMLECRELKNLWLPQPKSRHPGFGYEVGIAAAGIAYDLPIAGYGLGGFAVIDSYFQLPGIYNVKTGTWVVTDRKIAA